MIRRAGFLILVLLVTVSFASCIADLNVKDGSDAVHVVIRLFRKVEIEDDTSFSGTVYTLILRNCQNRFSITPVKSGPLDFIGIYSFNGNTFVSFHSIIPRKPVVSIDGKIVEVVFPKSRSRYDYSFSSNMTFGDVVKYLAESLKINIILSNDVTKLNVPSIKMDNTTPEDALRTLITALNLNYMYFPNGTMYIAKSPDEIRKKLLEFWGEDSVESIIEDIKEGFLKGFSNESMLVSVGTPENLKKIFQALAERYEAEKYYDFVNVEDKDSAASMIQDVYGDRVKVFTNLPGKAIMIYGNKLDVLKAENMLKKAGLISPVLEKKKKENEGVQRAPTYAVIEVSNSKSAKTVLEELFPDLKVIGISDYRMVIYGPEDSIKSARQLLLDVGLLGYVKEAKKEEEEVVYQIMDVKNPQEISQALSVIFSNKLKVATAAGKLILVGPKQLVEDAKRAVKRLATEEKEEEVTEVLSLSDPEEKAKILGDLFSDLKIIPGKGGIVVKGKKSRVEEMKAFLKNLDKIEVKKSEEVKIAEVSNPSEVSGIVPKVFENLKVIPFGDDKVILVGESNVVESAVGFLKKIAKPAKKEENLVMRVLKIPGISQEQLGIAEKIKDYVKGVEVFRVSGSDKVVLLGNDENSIDKAASMLNEILSGVPEPVMVKDGKITIRSDDMPIGDVVKKVLEKMGKSVVMVDNLATLVNLYLDNVSFEKFEKVVERFGVDVKLVDGIYYVSKKVEKKEEKKEVKPAPSPTPTSTPVTPAPPKKEEKNVEKLHVEVNGDVVSLKSNGATLRDIIATVASKLSKNIVFVDSPDIPVTLTLNNVNFDNLVEVLNSFGYEMEKSGDVYYVKKTIKKITPEATSSNVMFDVKFHVGKADINVENVSLSQLIKKLSEGFGKNIVFVDVPTERVTLNVKSMDFKDMEDLLGRFGYDLEEIDGIYYLTKMGKSLVAKVAYGFDKLKDLVDGLNGKIFYDNTTGMVIIRNLNSGAYEMVKNFIGMLEKSPPQVAIEVKIVEEQTSDNLGMSANVNIKSSGGDINISNTGIELKTKVLTATDYENYLRGLLGGDVSVGINGKSSNGKSRIIASPNITTMNGKEATIRIGGEKTFITPDGTRLTFPIGVNLQITPFVKPDGKIDLVVNVSISDVQGSYPEITQNERSATTRVVLKNGQTLVIGGLTRESNAKVVEKVPILGDLPIIGWLFRTESTVKETRNLEIFITAKVVGEK